MKAKRVTPLNRALFEERGDIVPLPPIYWFVRGPRGGLYEASSERYRRIERTNMTEADWMTGKDVVYVIDESDGLRYLRPGTKRHAFAVAEGA